MNSDILSLYAVSHSPIYQGGYRKFSTQYLKNIPIVVPADSSQIAAQVRIIELVRSITSGFTRSLEAESPVEQRLAQRLIAGARAEINRLTRTLYGLDERDNAWIRERVSRLGIV